MRACMYLIISYNLYEHLEIIIHSDKIEIEISIIFMAKSLL